MKTITIFLAILSVTVGVKAQGLIAVQNGGSPKFYTKLPDAVAAAMDGDTVYVPGGSFESVNIRKKVCIIGVGCNPDSTVATSRTLIDNIILNPGADHGSVTGIVINSINTSAGINGYGISRCKVYSIDFRGFSTTSNFDIHENIINYLDLPGTNHFISNNIFTYVVGPNGGINYSIIRNNIFLYTPRYAGDVYAFYANYSIVENNIIEQSGWSSNSSIYSVFHNNVNGGIDGVSGTNQGSGSIYTGGGLNTVFVKYDKTATDADNIYKNDFRLPLNSPYKNAGTDGTDIGIYGGAFPWKEGSVPFNPHFQSIKIDPKTDASGNLKVKVTVAAQDN